MNKTTPEQTVFGIISSSPENLTKISTELKNLGLSTVEFTKPSEVYVKGANIQFSGFIADLRTLLKLDSKEKIVSAEIEKFFPFMRVNYVENRVVGTYGTSGGEGEIIFKNFSDECLRLKPAKAIRLHARKMIYANVTYQGSDANSPVLQGNTFNLSQGGAFILNIHNSFKKSDSIILSFHENPDLQKISAQVIWTLPWGKSLQKPAGLGVRFESLTPLQSEALEKILSLA